MQTDKMGFVDYGTHAEYAHKPSWESSSSSSSMDIPAAGICLFVPLLMFGVISGLMGSTLRHNAPVVCWVLIAMAIAVVLLSCVLTLNSLYRRFKGKTVSKRDPTWYVLFALTMLCALGSGLYVGNDNYFDNIRPVKDIDSLSVYPNVDVTKAEGRQLMDAGRVTFVEGTQLDMRRGMGLKNFHRYCVAPITFGNATLATYDFWAVGIDCCTGSPGDFHCGEYNNPHAHSGIRLTNEDETPFFNLAVKQAASAFGTASPHPLFFLWVQDPISVMDAHHRDSWSQFLLGLAMFFGFQVVALTVAVFMRFLKASRM